MILCENKTTIDHVARLFLGFGIIRSPTTLRVDTVIRGGFSMPEEIFDIVDEDGKRLYTNEEAGLLLKMPLPAFQLVWPKCAKLNGLTEEAMKESAKKSVRAPASASSTVGPTTSAKPSGNSPVK